MKRISIWEQVKIMTVIIVGSLLCAAAMNFFLIPANVYASGFTGAAQLLSNIFTEYTPLNIINRCIVLTVKYSGCYFRLDKGWEIIYLI